MRRLTDDMTRLVGSIHVARHDRRRLLRDLKSATANMKRAVAHLRRSFATDLAGGRAAWLGAPASVARRVEEPPSLAPEKRETEVEPEEEEPELKDAFREAAAKRQRLAAERRVREEAGGVQKAREGRKRRRHESSSTRRRATR